MHEFDKCDIYNIRWEKAAEGYVLEYGSGVMEVRTRELAYLNRGQDVLLYVLNSQTGESRYRAQVVQVNENSVLFDNVTFLKANQKRSNTRVAKQLKFNICYKIENGREVKLEKPVPITMLNISALGMYFNSFTQIRANEP